MGKQKPARKKTSKRKSGKKPSGKKPSGKKTSGKKHTRRLAGYIPLLGLASVGSSVAVKKPKPPNVSPPKTPPSSPRGFRNDGTTNWMPNPYFGPGAKGIRTKKRKSKKKRKSNKKKKKV